eukprot:gene24718-14092_t
MTTSTTGTGTITLGSVVDGYQTFAAAGVSNGDSVRYVIEDGTSNWEIGSGTYTASGTTLSRTPSESSGGGSAIDLSGDAIVFISAIASDIQPVTLVTTTFTATAGQTAFTVSYTAGLVEVFLNGAKLSAADFTATNGTSVVLASGANVGDTVDVVAYGTVSVSNTYTQAQANALFVDVAGDTMTGDLNLGDSIKVQFGADQDLQIYHDGSNSYLRDGGTGDLKVLATNFAVKNLGDSINFITTNSSTGAMDLYHNGTSRLTTTSTGVDITGTLTSDDTFTLEGAHPDIALGETDTTNLNTGLTSASGAFQVSTINDSYNFGSRVNRLNIDHSTGDISFYEDTGTTAKLVWDASAEQLQLDAGVALELNGWTITESGGSLYFATGGTNKMKLDASGNLDVVGNVNSNATIT